MVKPNLIVVLLVRIETPEALPDGQSIRKLFPVILF
jgi:hypothetical protein